MQCWEEQMIEYFRKKISIEEQYIGIQRLIRVKFAKVK